MDRKEVLLRMMSLVLVLLLVSACSTPQPTAPPPTATPAPSPTATATPEPPVWDYVALGDSIVIAASDFGYTNYYATYLEADLGVKVVQNNKGVVYYRTDQLLDRIRNDQGWRDDISKAEVVTVYVGSADLIWALQSEYMLGTCDGDDGMDCIREMYKTARANYDAILDELLTLCTPHTIIRVATSYCASLEKYGYDGDPVPLYSPLNEQIIQSAAEHNIPVARVDIAFNGVTGDEDAKAKGYLLTAHPTELGAQVIADVHRELGYEPTVP